MGDEGWGDLLVKVDGGWIEWWGYHGMLVEGVSYNFRYR